MSIVVVSGTRTIIEYDVVRTVLENCGFEFDELVHGDHPGQKVRNIPYASVDRLAGRWAERNDIPVKPMPADWDKYSFRAGPIRNGEMFVYANRRARELGTTVAFAAVWDGRSHGTADALSKARAHQIPICKAIVWNGEIRFEFINHPHFTESYTLNRVGVPGAVR